MTRSDVKKQQIREAAEQDLATFIKLVHPQRELGQVHHDLIDWWQRPDAKQNQLALLPRDHGKSAFLAYRATQHLTRYPASRILYLSSTANLAVKQLKFIKDILTSDRYRFYWPEMVNLDPESREKWTESEISIDHPIRKLEAIRDPSIFTGGLTTTLTGLHADVICLDDIVVFDNAYTEEGRTRVEQQYSLLSSIGGSEYLEWTVGTRYHPKDLYGTLKDKKIELYGADGDLISEDPLYEIFEKVVEDRGDGTGNFLWPVQVRADGKRFGFDAKILARKRTQYLDKTQFRAQYYNDPNDVSAAEISPEYFQYYKREHLSRQNGYWYFQGRRLNVFAAIDFAFSLRKEADYTSLVVVGVDQNYNFYILDIDRFKTNQIGEYFNHILALHRKWDFRKLRAEVTGPQLGIVNAIKQGYITKHGLALSIEDHRPTRHDGTKAERISAELQPRYQNLQVWHYQGGHTQALEEELVLKHPPHDDVKDALASCIGMCTAPSPSFGQTLSTTPTGTIGHPRFGGI